MKLSLYENDEWETSNGRIIKIKDMSDFHIAGSIKKLENEIDPLAEKYILKLKTELNQRYQKFYDGFFKSGMKGE